MGYYFNVELSYFALYMGLLYPWDIIIIPMYNVHPYFSLKNLGKKYALYMAKYGTSLNFLYKKVNK